MKLDILISSNLTKNKKKKNKENGQNKRKRMRNITWFNPPYSMNVSTNIASKVLTFIKDCFPEGHPLHKIFNKNTVKVSYKTTPNVKQLISSHNSTILKQNMKQEDPTITKNCNCRKNSDPCPLEKKCMEECVVYQATVTETKTDKKHTYIGLTADTFKERHRNHKKSFNLKKYSKETELSKFIWVLKTNKIEYSIKWKILEKAKPFSPVSKTCRLCIREKYYLIFKPELCTLNERNELGSHCRHKKRLLHSSL